MSELLNNEFLSCDKCNCDMLSMTYCNTKRKKININDKVNRCSKIICELCEYCESCEDSIYNFKKNICKSRNDKKLMENIKNNLIHCHGISYEQLI